MGSTAEAARSIRDSLAARYVNRTDMAEAIILSAYSGLDFFALGTPGTAKSTMIKEFLNQHFEGNVFTATLDRTTTASRLVGNVHPKRYMEEGIEEHQTENMIVEADMAFVDEVFKGAKGCRECLLDILADRTFKQVGREHPIPLLTMFSASNELPTDNSDSAFYSRLQIRVYVKDLSEPTDVAEALWADRPDPTDDSISREDIAKAREEIRNIKISEETRLVIIDDLLPALADLKVNLDQRKRQKAFGQAGSMIQTAAWLRGATETGVEDLLSTRFILTSTPRDFEDIRNVLIAVSTPKEAQEREKFTQVSELAQAMIQHPEQFDASPILDVIRDLKSLSKIDDLLSDEERSTRRSLARQMAAIYLSKTNNGKDK